MKLFAPAPVQPSLNESQMKRSNDIKPVCQRAVEIRSRPRVVNGRGAPFVTWPTSNESRRFVLRAILPCFAPSSFSRHLVIAVIIIIVRDLPGFSSELSFSRNDPRDCEPPPRTRQHLYLESLSLSLSAPCSPFTCTV